LLYVPDLDPSDPCVNETAPYVPATAVRQAQLPPTNYNLIALAPWINANCTKSYLDSAHTDPLRAMIFYKPSNSSSKPPGPGSSFWNLNDDGRWKTSSGYPIFAVPGDVGEEMMYELSLYSGNVSSVPFGENISELYNPDPNDYVRIWTELEVNTPSSLPSIWVYFLIIAGVFLVVVSGTSFLMHLVQSRRRASLRHRVIAGEVNLEGMGIKRLSVPMEHIQKFPLFTYHYEPTAASPPASPRTATTTRSPPLVVGSNSTSRDQSESVPAAAPTGGAVTVSEKGSRSPVTFSNVATDYQPVCAICLQAFQNRATVIRELPCGHIYHPDCIDEFLNQVSSLCPLCKASMLPKGYCPRITNVMVRRERAVRRLRERVVIETDADSGRGRMHSWGSTIKQRIFNTNDSPDSSTSTELQPHPGRKKIQTSQPKPSTKPVAVNQDRAEDLARQRMRELAGSPIASDDGESRLTRCMATIALFAPP
jgi:hypothetical protein